MKENKTGRASEVEGEGRKAKEKTKSKIFILILEGKKDICSTERKKRAEINGSICIDFLVGIRVYLQKHE